MLLPGRLLLLFVAVASAAPVPYDFHENYRDSPSAEAGPPSSYHATRDRSRLPFEICGIVAAYLATLLLWGILLLTLGRKMRRKALNPPKALELEMEPKPRYSYSQQTPQSQHFPQPLPVQQVQPHQQAPPTPMSARSATSWFRRFKKGDSVAGSSPVSPIVQSPTSFDQAVLNADKERAQADMERLYAAVMDHDAKKHSRQNSTETSQHYRRPSAMSTETPISPVRAIYHPPTIHPPNPPAPPAPLPRQIPRDAPPPSPRSILKRPSVPKSPRFNLKNLRISAPIQSYGGASPTDEGRTPLSPRFYPTPPAPPSPPTQDDSPVSPPLPPPTLSPPPNPRSPRRPRDLTLTISPPPAPRLNVPTSAASTQRSATATPTSQLPFRAYSNITPVSPGIQTTILDHDPKKQSLHQTPRTGVPFTPYTPYMPFTPVTPVTPHLVTRRERKERKKRGERAGLGDVREEGMVQSPKELFGEAY